MRTFPPASLGIFLLSGSALAYEVILVRLLSMTRFHHLAFMVLSLALLAYGVSGVVLAYLRKRLTIDYRIWFSTFAGLFALGSVLCYQLSQRITVNPGQWLISPVDIIYLTAIYLILSLPLLAAACGVGLAYCAAEKNVGSVGSIYRADLLGAAVGSLGALAVLWLPRAQGLWLPWCGGFATSALMIYSKKKWYAAVLLLLAISGPATNIMYAVRLIPSAGKPLSMILSAEGAQIQADVFSPLGRITVTTNQKAPYRRAPGLSLAFDGIVPEQWIAFRDGDALETLLSNTIDQTTLSYLDYMPQALAYYMAPRRRVLVLDTIAAEHTVQAVTKNATAVDIVLSNPAWRQLLRQDETAPVFGIYMTPPVRLIINDSRRILGTDSPAYDLIVFKPPDQSALTADHLHTVEAFRQALAKLADDGVLSISGPSDLPPKAGLRLLSTASTALRLMGVVTPADHLVLIRSLRTIQLFVKKNPLNAADIGHIRAFCRTRHFDPVWFPGMDMEEANQWNRMAAPIYYQSAAKLLGPDSTPFYRQYKFNIRPLFDDRPYFARFLKLRTLQELLSLRASGALGLLSFAEPVLAATLLQAVVLSLLIIWLPLRRFKAQKESIRLGFVFFSLGIGFLSVEFAVMKKLALFLNEPVIALAVTLAGFLAMAGAGGGISSRLLRRQYTKFKPAGIAAALVVSIVILYGIFLSAVLSALSDLGLLLRMLVALIIIAPLAVSMGLPFPLAIAALKKADVRAVPWAWGLNGCGSLIGPILGIILAIYIGVTYVFWAGVFCYGLVSAMTVKTEM